MFFKRPTEFTPQYLARYNCELPAATCIRYAVLTGGMLFLMPAAVLAQALSFNPSTVDFGDIALGSTSTAQLSLANTSRSQTFTGLSFNTSDDAFAVDPSACGVELPASTSCLVDVSFTPTEVGTVEATLQVNSDQGVSVTADLMGNGLEPLPDLTVSPVVLDFGDIEIGATSAPQMATLENTGNAEATDLIFSTPSSGFDANTSDCGTTLAAGASCEISITFTPEAAGSASVTLSVDSSEGVSAPLELTGNGISTGTSELAFDPANIDFGDVEVGSPSTSQAATVANSGSADATGLSFSALGSGFDADTSNCGTTLVPGESCDVSVTFTPAATGAASATLSVDSAEGASASLVLAGNGVEGGDGGPGTVQGDTVLVSRASGPDGAKGNNVSGEFVQSPVSADGRYVVFDSYATNLHPDDTNNNQDVFVRDLQTDETILVSRATGSDGAVSNARSHLPSISDNGRYVAFQSDATNLHPDDSDGTRDIFVRDLQSNETMLISRATGIDGIKANAGSVDPAMSADGSRVAFQSAATNLNPVDTDDVLDIFVRDLTNNETILVSKATGTGAGKGNANSRQPSISSDGRYIAFASTATNLHPDDLDNGDDVYLRDIQAEETVLVSRANGVDGSKGDDISLNPSISNDGKRVAFSSFATNLHPDDPDSIRDVYVRDLNTHEIILASRSQGIDGTKGTDFSWGVAISGDGRFVTYHSQATNLHPEDGDTEYDIYLRSLEGSDTFLVSRAGGADGIKGNDHSRNPAVSIDGRFVVFWSEATNLHSDDTDAVADVYLRDVLGQPAAVELGLSPSTIDFGDVEVGTTSAPQTATLENTGSADATGLSFSEPGSGFNADTSACGTALAAGTSCEISVTFTPAATGSASATLSVDSAEGASASLVLAGNGVSAQVPDLSFAPASLDFGNVEVGTTSTPQTATLENTGDGAASSLSFSAPDAFDVNPADCGTAIGAGQGCSVVVTYTALAAGPVEAELKVDSAESASAALGLIGEGVTPPAPDLAFTPENIDFGEVPVGVTAGPLSATLDNTGDADATGLSFTTPGSGFNADTSDCSSTLSAGASCTVSVAFTPASPGGSAATLEVESAEGAAATLGSANNPPDDYLYYFSHKLKSIFRMDPGQLGTGRSLTTSNNDLASVFGLQVSPGSCEYYWVSGGEEIRRASIDGAKEEVIHAVSGGLFDLEFDRSSGLLYFTRGSSVYRGELTAAGLNDVQHLVNTPDAVEVIRSLEVDFGAGRMYWTGIDGIWSADLDGSNVQLLVDVADTASTRPPRGLALDLQAGKIYWGDESDTDANGDVRIHRANLDGTDYEVVLDLQDVPHDADGIADLAVDPDLSKLFWHEINGEFYRANLDGSEVERVPQVESSTIAGFTFVPGDIDAQCGLPEADICPEGAQCDRVEAIYWHGGNSGGGSLWRSRADGRYREKIHEWTAGIPHGIAVSRKLGKVFWTQTENKVYRANLDGSNVELLLELPFSSIGDYPRGIAVDPVAKKMYVVQQRRDGHVADQTKATLWSADLDGSNLQVRFVLEHHEGPGPTIPASMTGPQVDTEERTGYVLGPSGDSSHPDIYWGTLYRFELDGTAPPEVVKPFLPPELYPEDAVASRLPSRLQLDALHQKIYWTQLFSCGDGCGFQRTYRMNLDGSNVELVPWLQNQNRMPLAIDPYSRRMYGTRILENDHISRWSIEDGEDTSILHAEWPGVGTHDIALLREADGVDWATLSLSGVGVAPELSVEPGSLDFGAVPVGGTGEVQSVTLSNTGNEPLGVTGITSVSSPFGRVGGNCAGAPFDVEPGESCTIDYIFQSTGEGVFEQNITVDSSAGAESFTLTGEGISATPDIGVTPTAIAAAVADGDSTTRALTISNEGGIGLGWEVDGTDCALPEWVSVAPASGTVPVGGEQVLDVTLDATALAPGKFSTALCLASNDPSQPETVVPVDLTVTDEAGSLVAMPSAADFGEVMTGYALVETVTVSNSAGTGAGPLELSTLEIVSGNAVFAVTGGSCSVGGSIEPGDSCTIDVTFTPDGEGAFTGELTIESTDGQSVAASLAGDGIPVPDPVFQDRFEDGGE